MPDNERPPGGTITLARFIDVAAKASGGMEALGRRLGLSSATVERMSVSDQPLLADDATLLLARLGLSAVQLPDEGRRREAPDRD